MASLVLFFNGGKRDQYYPTPSLQPRDRLHQLLLTTPPSQLRLLNRDPDLLRSKRAVLSVDPVRECLAF